MHCFAVEDIQQKLERACNLDDVHPKGTKSYEDLQKVRNGACNNRFPKIIVRPETTADVACVVKFASKNDIEISVRSGGHSAVCGGIKDNALQIDLRKLNKIELLPKSAKDVSFDYILKISIYLWNLLFRPTCRGLCPSALDQLGKMSWKKYLPTKLVQLPQLSSNTFNIRKD